MCEERGTLAKYHGETSTSCNEHALVHLDDARQKKSSSHMHIHLEKAAHPGAEVDMRDVYMFQVECKNKSALNCRLAEAV